MATVPQLVKTYFEPISSDIMSRRPYLGPYGLHIYIPTCSVRLVLARLERAASQMKKNVGYEVGVVLGFLGLVCYCGVDHWCEMGWKVEGGGVRWPADNLGVDRSSVISSILQLKKMRR